MSTVTKNALHKCLFYKKHYEIVEYITFVIGRPNSVKMCTWSLDEYTVCQIPTLLEPQFNSI